MSDGEVIVHDFSCQCGSNDRFMERIAAKEKAKGNIPMDMPVALDIKVMAVANPKPVIPYLPGTLKPGGTALFDVCMKCGRFYCFRAIECEVALLGDPRMMGMPGGPRHP
jgi:hypothetical protein